MPCDTLYALSSFVGQCGVAAGDPCTGQLGQLRSCRSERISHGLPRWSINGGGETHFSTPEVQASTTANSYVIGDNAENEQRQEFWPCIVNQPGHGNLASLKQIDKGYQTSAAVGVATAEGDDDAQTPT